MRLVVIPFLLTALFINSCIFSRKIPKEGKRYVLKSGLTYTINKNGTGLKPSKGEKIKVHFVGKVQGGGQFTSTYERNLPVVFQLGSGQVINGLDEFFSLAREGVEATVEVPAKLAYGARQIGDISPNSNLVYEVEFLEILEPPVPFDVGKNDTLVLESGLKYIKVKTTNNQKASAHRDVVLDYTGFFENGNIFDSSVERGFPIQFTLGIGQVIKGWDEGVQQMKEGEKFRFIIPSQLAYGSKGFLPLIKPNTNLIFDIELLEIR